MSSAPLPFLLEIGTEEIPDWMIERALAQLLESLEAIFLKEKLSFESIGVAATPRRLVVRAYELQARQADDMQTIKGPSVEIAYRGHQLTQVGLAFIRKHNISGDERTNLQEEKSGRAFLGALRRIPGRRTVDILAEALPKLVLGVHFPKTMYWTGKGGPRFIRPIRWIVALLGDEVIPFELAGVRSGAVTSGHRRLGAREIAVTTADYEQRLRENYVILSAEERRHKIHDGMAGVRVKRDDALVETLAYLTEHPTPIVGSFDAEFLELPEEVLVTVMRHHQKYFSVEDEHGKLAPQFVAVMNIPSDPEGFVRRGNERVLRARFNDARFFWETDQKKSLAARVADLAHVTFQAKLGTYLEKTERVKALVGALGGDAHAVRAAELAKCDLTTELVKEFTELQGVVGGLYARAQGEEDAVWQAIYDHYKPESMEDAIPRNRTGQIVALADKLDTLRGCFGVGLIPTGSRDPFALRRAAQGVVKILVEGKVDLDLAPLVNDPTDGAKALTEFLQDRIRYYFKDVRGFQYDEVNAAMAAGWSNLVDLEARLIRIRNLRSSPDFEPLAASFKRIRNILDQQKFTGTSAAAIDEKLLQDGPERDLYDEYRSIAGQPIESVISQLRPKVDLFFDKVLVNAPEDDVRRNRLMLLGTLLLEFSNIADFSEIVTTS
jgi:glycyl-tRNA synthetase beta chain